MKRVVAQLVDAIAQRLHIRLMTHRRIGIGFTARRFRGVFTSLSMHIVQLFCLSVIRLKVFILEFPLRGNTALMDYLLKISLSQSQQRCPIQFSISTHPVASLRTKRLTVFVIPVYLSVIAFFLVNFISAPVVFFTR